MKLITKKNLLPISIIIIIFGIFISYKVITTYKAHETFEGYCKWRGLVVENKATDYGFCKDSNTGKEYKMVLFNGRWYLDGDLPCGFLCV